MSQRLLEGEVIDANGDVDREVDRLRDEVNRLTRERDALRAENVRLRQRLNQVDGPVMQLRQMLEPLYRSLQALWGEIDVIEPQQPAGASTVSASAAQPQTGKASAVWDAWKERFGGATARIIDALLLHGEANTQQLAIIAQCRRQTVSDGIHKLNKAGLLNKNGGVFSLKQISNA